jgi:hypothetical protein
MEVLGVRKLVPNEIKTGMFVLVAALIGYYALIPSDFIIDIYPKTHYDVNIENGSFKLIQTPDTTSTSGLK